MSVENDIQVRKSNPLIQSMGNPSLLANKILLTALVHAEMADPKNLSPLLSPEDWKRVKRDLKADYTKGLVAIFPQSEIRKFAKKSNSGSYYDSLNSILNSNPMTKTDGFKSLQNQWTVVLNSNGLHETISLITACAYDEKTHNIFIKFSDEEKIQKQIYNLKSNYTTLSYKKMMLFKSNYASKLYEIIKSRIDYDDATSKTINDTYEYTYNIAHLKYMLGVLNPFYSNETIKMLGAKNPDYDVAEGMNVSGGMPKWYDFKRYCLDKCQKEINELTEFTMSYTPGERKGKGGKICDVTIIIKRKVDVVNTAPVLNSDELFDLIDQVRDIITEKLSTADIKTLLDKAGNDIEKIRTACKVASEHTNIDSYMGFLIKAIENDWKPKIKIKKTEFEQNSYDFEALEKQLLKN